MARFVLTAQLQLQAPNNVGQIVSQIQNQLNGINVNVQVQGSARAQQQIQQITQSTDQATSAADRMGRAFAVSIRRFAAFSIATRAVGLFTSTLSNAIQTSIDFERQLIKVSQVTGKSVSGLRDLTDEITNLSRGWGVSSQSLLDVTTILTQAGLTATDTKVALNSLAKAALAPNFDSITQTAEGAIAILAQFKLGVGALEAQLGSINAVAGAFAVEASDLIDVIRRTGGVFKSSGGDLNELLALFTSVRATTRESAESIGTGLRTIFTRIQRPETIEFLKQFGVELVDLEGKFVGPYEAIRRLSGALSGLGERDLGFIKIAEELGGFRQIGKVLPLLQQFSTAEAALNVATNANNSLTQDAISAQAALAVRIMKVREEFLALVRGITETPTFQIMANTALTLASALIKVADSIKPLLPLLTAVAAFRAVRGVGSFVGSAVAGLQSGRTFNQGGKVHHFATGGLVPGVGNSDTVPAMLSPGEFVIRKSSVQKLGASNLAGMNNGGSVGKYADGGIVNEKKIGAAILENVGFDQSNTVTVSRQNIESKLPKGLKLSDNYPVKGQKSFTLEREGLSNDTYSVFRNTLRGNLVKVAEDSAKSLAADLGLSQVRTSVPSGDVDKFLRGINDGSMGNLFEDTLKVLSGSPFSTEPQRAFDFERGISSVLKDDYRNITAKYVDAKSSFAQSTPGKFEIKAANALAYEAQLNNYVRQESEDERKKRASSEMKAAFGKSKSSKKKHFGGMISKFATGGGVGTDTVPALLTPGEFVVNKASAQSIGYSNLGRMNRVGRYANGGVVQRFNVGGVANPFASMSGTMGGQAQQTQGPQNNSSNRSAAQATQQATQATRQFGMGLSVVSASLQAMIPPITDTSSSVQKFGNSVLSMITTIGGVVFALESFGVSLTKKNVTDFLSGRGAPAIQNKANAASMGSRYDSYMSRGRNAQVSGLGTYNPATQSRDYIPAAGRTRSDALRRLVQSRRLKLDVDSSGNPITDRVQREAARAANPAARLAARERFQNVMPTTTSSSMLKGAGAVGQGLMKLAGPLTVAAGAVSLLNAAITASSTAEIDKRKAIEKGDVEAAGKAAGEGADLESQNTSRMIGGLIGGIVGSFGGPFGTAIGAVAGAGLASLITSTFSDIGVLFGGNTKASAVALAQAQAQATKTQKAFEQGEKDATKAMEDFNNGTLTATEALAKVSNVAAEAQNLRAANDKAIEANKQNKSTNPAVGALRALGNFVSMGYIETQNGRNDRIDQENKAMDKASLDAERKAFDMARPMRNEVMREGILQGLSQQDINARIESSGGKGSAKLNAEGLNFANKSIEARNRGDNEAADKFQAQSDAAYEQAKEQEDSYRNLTREIDAAKKKFEAINLGFRSVVSNSDAAALAMTNLSASFEVGALPVQQAAATLEAALTSAGQNISKAQFDDALKNVTTTFESLGASQQQVDKFKGAMEGIAGVQRNFPAIFEQMKSQIQNGGLRSMSANDAGKAFKTIVDEQLKGAGIGDAARKQIVESMGEVKLSQEDMNKIDAGDYSVLEKYLGDAGEEASKVLKSVVDNMAKVNQELISVTKLRIEAERNLVEAQKDALSLTLEGRELQGKYGGKVVTNEERRQNVLARSNANGIGPDMKTGSLAEIRARNNAMSGLFGATEQQRRVKNGMAGAGGVEADEAQKNIQKAQKDQINTIRELVKLEEENLKLIGEKNKLEKDSIDALVSGDIDKFMQSQATIGATAAIATGNKSLMNAFGSEALGAAAVDIRRQQEAGVGSLYGRQLGGQGGLTQQAYGAALNSRGITDPRYAQMASGNTAEEEASKSRLRDYGTALDETGQLGVQMAEMQVETANLRVNEAKIEVAKFVNGGADAVAKANGGLIYASRGMFIPRGTDTVPAMLTPGEFVVRREAVNRGNNLQLLQQMNGAGGGMTNSSEVMGFARGGRVQYYSAGSSGPVQQQAGSSSINGDNFINQLSKQLDRLENAVVQHSVGNSSVRVDIMGGGMLQQIASNIEQNVRNSVSQQLSNSHATENGIGYNGSVLGQA